MMASSHWVFRQLVGGRKRGKFCEGTENLFPVEFLSFVLSFVLFALHFFSYFLFSSFLDYLIISFYTALISYPPSFSCFRVSGSGPLSCSFSSPSFFILSSFLFFCCFLVFVFFLFSRFPIVPSCISYFLLSLFPSSFSTFLAYPLLPPSLLSVNKIFTIKVNKQQLCSLASNRHDH